MRVGIIGAGGIGSAIGAMLARNGHEVIVGSRNPDAASAVVARIGAREATTYRRAAEVTQLLFFCVKWEHSREALASMDDLSGCIVVDASNPENPDGRSLAIGHTQSGAEIIEGLIPGARVVKAFNYLYAELLHDPEGLKRVNPSIFVCGDDARAKEIVSALIRSCGLEPIDSGPLRNARYLEPLAFLMVQLVRTQGWPPDSIAMKLSHS